MIEQTPYASGPLPPSGTNSFAENPEPRCPCVLLLVTSGSMKGTPIDELNIGLRTYKDCLAADHLAAKRVETAVIAFGGEVQVVNDFTTGSPPGPVGRRRHADGGRHRSRD